MINLESRGNSGAFATNQRADLTTIIVAQERAFITYDFSDTNPHIDLTIKSDSQYAVQCMNIWMEKRMKRGWTNAAGKDVANADLLQQALDFDIQLKRKGNVCYMWIPREKTA